jgi:hypothetical protein
MNSKSRQSQGKITICSRERKDPQLGLLINKNILVVVLCVFYSVVEIHVWFEP